MAPADSGGRRRGRVADFDAERGVGTIEADSGEAVFFHCTAIADGTRQIDTGLEVSYRLRPGHLGRWEAGEIRPD